MYRKIGATDEKNGRKKRKRAYRLFFPLYIENIIKNLQIALDPAIDQPTNQPTSQQHTKTHTHTHSYTYKKTRVPGDKLKNISNTQQPETKDLFFKYKQNRKKKPKIGNHHNGCYRILSHVYVSIDDYSVNDGSQFFLYAFLLQQVKE